MSLPRLPTNCPRCDGTGRVSKTYARGRGMARSTVSEPCPRCRGSGITVRLQNPSPVRGLRRASPSKRHPTRVGQGMPWPWLDRTTGGLLYVRRGLRRLRPYRPGAKRKNPLLQVVTPNGKRRTRRMKVRGQRRPARRYLKSILGATSARGLVRRPYGKRRGGLSWRKRKNPLLQVVTPNPGRRMVARALLRARQFSQGRRKWPDRGTWPSDGVAELERINRVLGKLARRRVARKAWHATGSKMRTPERTMRDAMKYEDRLRGFSFERNPVVRGYAGRGGSRVRGGQRLSGVRFASPAEARAYPGFAKALATFKAFHGRAPTHFTKVRLEDGDKHVSRRAVVMVGEAPAIEYRTWRYANSSKSHTKDGRRITWRHKMGELGGKPAYYVHDPVSGVTSLLGGTYRVAGRPAFYHH